LPNIIVCYNAQPHNATHLQLLNSALHSQLLCPEGNNQFNPNAVTSGGLKLKLLRRPNEDLESNPRATLWRWRNNGGTWGLQETAFTSTSCERFREL